MSRFDSENRAAGKDAPVSDIALWDWGGGCTLVHQQLQHDTKKPMFWQYRPSNNGTKQGVRGHLQLWVSVDMPLVIWGGLLAHMNGVMIDA